MNAISEIKARVGIIDLAERLGLKKDASASHNGNVMFHGPGGNGNTPSISMNADKGLFNDFAAGGKATGKGGSQIDLVMLCRGGSVADAIGWICNEYGIINEREERAEKRERTLAETIADSCLKNLETHRGDMYQYLTGRGIAESAIDRAVLCKNIGFNTWHSPSKHPGEKFYGGPAVSFVIRRKNYSAPIAVDHRFVDADLNGGLKTQCHGTKEGMYWCADHSALAQAHTVVLVESSINALSVDSADLPGWIGLSVLGIGNWGSTDWSFLRGKKVIIGFDKDKPDDKSKTGPGQRAAWEIYQHLVEMDIAVFLLDTTKWRRILGVNNEDVEEYGIDINDLLLWHGQQQLANAIKNIDKNMIPGVPKKHSGHRPRVYIPPVDIGFYWRVRCEEQHTIFTKTVKVKTPEGDEIYDEVDTDMAGFRIANMSSVTISGPIATITGAHDDMPSTFYVSHVQTRRGQNILQRRVFNDGLYDMKEWEKLGAVFNPAQFKRTIAVMETLAANSNRKAANFVGLAWLEGKIRMNDGADCYFPEPADEHSAYAKMSFHSGRQEDARTLVNAYQSTYGMNAAAIMLVWTVCSHLKMFAGFYPHMVIGAPKGSGKSKLIEYLGINTGILKFSGAGMNEYRLRINSANTSFPVAYDELSNISKQAQVDLQQKMQTLYTADITKSKPKGRIVTHINFAPIMIGGEDVGNLDNVISKTVCATLVVDLRGKEIEPHSLPKWPMRQWLEFLAGMSRDRFNTGLAEAKKYCLTHAASRDQMAARMVGNYALVLFGWRLVCEFTGLPESHGNFVDCLMGEMNRHIQQTESSRQPWVWVMEKLAFAMQRQEYPYPWDIQAVTIGSSTATCLLVKPKDVMDYIHTSKDLSEFRTRLPITTGNALRAQLKEADVLMKETVHPYIRWNQQRRSPENKAEFDDSGKVVRYLNYVAIPVGQLLVAGITLPRVDYTAEEFSGLLEMEDGNEA